MKRQLANSCPKNCAGERKRECSSTRLFPVETDQKSFLGESDSDIGVTPIQEENGIYEVEVSPYCHPGLESIQTNDLGIYSLFESPNYLPRQEPATT